MQSQWSNAWSILALGVCHFQHNTYDPFYLTTLGFWRSHSTAGQRLLTSSSSLLKIKTTRTVLLTPVYTCRSAPCLSPVVPKQYQWLTTRYPTFSSLEVQSRWLSIRSRAVMSFRATPTVIDLTILAKRPSSLSSYEPRGTYSTTTGPSSSRPPASPLVSLMASQ